MHVLFYYIYNSLNVRGGAEVGDAAVDEEGLGTTVSFQNFKSQNFKLSVSNPKNKLSNFKLSVSNLSKISNLRTYAKVA